MKVTPKIPYVFKDRTKVSLGCENAQETQVLRGYFISPIFTFLEKEFNASVCFKDHRLDYFVEVADGLHSK